MKKIKLVLMFVVLSSILATSCSKDKAKEETPVPTPTPTPTTPLPPLTKFGIATLTVETFPNASTYDADGKFDLYFTISDGSNTIFNNYTARLVNKSAADFPIMFSYASGWTSNPFITYNLNSTFYINIFDDDQEDIPAGSYNYIGLVAVNLSQYIQTRPEYISVNYNGLYVKINCIWYTT